MMLGIWKSYQELEDNLSLEELEALIDFARKQRYEDKKFAAALKGVNLDEGEDTTTGKDIVDNIKKRVENTAQGIDPEIAEFNDLGIDVEQD